LIHLQQQQQQKQQQQQQLEVKIQEKSACYSQLQIGWRIILGLFLKTFDLVPA